MQTQNPSKKGPSFLSLYLTLYSIVASPNTLWAQREGELYITIQVSDAKDAKIDLSEDSLHFSAVNETSGTSYKLDLEFYGPIDVEVSIYLFHYVHNVFFLNIELQKVRFRSSSLPGLGQEGKRSLLAQAFETDGQVSFPQDGLFQVEG